MSTKFRFGKIKKVLEVDGGEYFNVNKLNCTLGNS